MSLLCLLTAFFTIFLFSGCNSARKQIDKNQHIIFYSDYGAIGDGVTDDFDAIIAAHEAANKAGAKVSADPGASYYIGGADKTARIETDTDWRGANFTIDDSAVTINENSWLDSWLFDVVSTKPSIQITSVQTLNKNQAKLDLSLPFPAVLVVTDTGTKRYIRRGPNQNPGANQTDVFIVDENGSVDQSAPIIWDFENVTSMTAFPIDIDTLTITGGTFTTIANTGNSDNNYMKRGIRISRSNTVVDGLVHLITGETEQGGPYDGFIKMENCANVTIINTTFTGRRGYRRPSRPNVTRGTYGINASRTINLSVINCSQTNDITDNAFWGVFTSNYSKNILFDNVEFSRFDAHQGVYNTTILNSHLGHQGIAIIGSGLLKIENTKVSGPNFINLRSDYGSTWEGDVIIRNCTFAPPVNRLNNNTARIINTDNDGQWDFGYPCYMPETITIEGLTVIDQSASAEYEGILLVGAVNTGTNTEPFPYRFTKTIYLSGFSGGKPWRMSNNYIRDNIQVQ